MNDNDLSLLVRAIALPPTSTGTNAARMRLFRLYINHPVALMDLLVHEGGVTDLATLVAAVLHDTIEDTQTTSEEVQAVFGTVIRTIVDEVTDDKALGRSACKQAQIDKAPNLSHQARAVKLADKICNLRDVAMNPLPVGTPIDARPTSIGRNRSLTGCAVTIRCSEDLFDEVYRQRPGMNRSDRRVPA